MTWYDVADWLLLALWFWNVYLWTYTLPRTYMIWPVRAKRRARLAQLELEKGKLP